jgi:hypothetical protein
VFRDVQVGYIRPAIHANRSEMRVSEWKHDALVGNKDRIQLQPIGCAKADFLDVTRRRVGVDPELHPVKLHHQPRDISSRM